MENNGNVICRARFKSSFMPFVVLIVVLILGFVTCVVLNRSAMNKEAGSYEGTYSVGKRNYENGNDKGIFSVDYYTECLYPEGSLDGIKKWEHSTTYIWGVKLTHHSNTIMVNSSKKHSYENKKYPGGIVACILTGLLALLLIFKAFMPMIIAKRCSLSLSTDKIEGQLKTTFGRKNLQMPIDHVDSVMTASSLMDKLRGGNTLLVSSNRGLIKFHYVQNADEFARAAMQRIGEVKKSAPAAAQPSAPAPSPSSTGADSVEKINALKQMLDSGLISQEQFEQKRDEIISKM